jgi:hypothetical protein
MSRLATIAAEKHRSASSMAAIPWRPIPNSPQERALNCQADELFFGGGAGGGKSYLLMGLAFTAHERSIIYRREYPQLRELIEKSREIVGKLGTYNGQEHIWRLTDGRTVEFGAVQYEHSVEKFQGRAHDAKFFDELAHFSELQYRTLSGWARTANPKQRVRVVATGNPPAGYQGQWVREYWGPWLDPNHGNPAAPGELVWYAEIAGKSVEVARGDDRPPNVEHEGESITPRSRTFIPARVDDNPYYMETGYKAILQSMPEPLRSQLLYGDFAAGGQDDPWQVFPSAWVEAAIARWTEQPPEGSQQDCLGGDPARGGKDNSAIAERWGEWFNIHTLAGSETPNGPAFAQFLISLQKGTPIINIDVIGIGSSPVDTLTQIGYECNSLSGADTSTAFDRSGKLGFRNKRAEWIWKFREALDPDYDSTIALPPNPRLKAGLLAMRWYLSGWKIMIEPKEDIKTRLGYSPDEAEAVIYASIGDESVAFWAGFSSSGLS